MVDITIPHTFQYRGRKITLGREPIILDSTDRTGATALDVYNNHFLFRAMVKYLLAPTSDSPSISSPDYNNYDDNLHYFLNPNLLRQISLDDKAFLVDDKHGFDVTEYQAHIDFAWEQIEELPMGELLELIKSKELITTKGNLIETVIKYMTDEGKETRVLDIKDDASKIGSSGQDKILGYSIKGLEAKKLYRVANAKRRKDRVYLEALTDEKLKDYTTFTFSIKNEQKPKFKDAPWKEYPFGKAHIIKVEVDFKGYFKSEMDEQGLEMPFRQHKDAVEAYEREIDEVAAKEKQQLKDQEESFGSAERVSSEEEQRQYGHLQEDVDKSEKLLRAISNASILLKQELLKEQASSHGNHFDSIPFRKLGTTPYIPLIYNDWTSEEQLSWEKLQLKHFFNKNAEQGIDKDVLEFMAKERIILTDKVEDWAKTRKYPKQKFSASEQRLLDKYQAHVEESNQELTEFDKDMGFTRSSLAERKIYEDIKEVQFQNREIIHINDDNSYKIFKNDIEINAQGHITNQTKSNMEIDFKELYYTKSSVRKTLRETEALNPAIGGKLILVIEAILGPKEEISQQMLEVEGAVSEEGRKIHEKWQDKWNQFRISKIGYVAEGYWPYRKYLTSGGGKVGASGAFTPSGYQAPIKDVRVSTPKQFPKQFPVLDEEGNPTKDEEGKIITETREDDKGNIITETRTSPEYSLMGTKYGGETIPETKPRTKVIETGRTIPTHDVALGLRGRKPETLNVTVQDVVSELKPVGESQSKLGEGASTGRTSKSTLTFLMYIKGQLTELDRMVTNA